MLKDQELMENSTAECILHVFLSHFACGSVNYETVEKLGNACI